jgi:hypothetical protein
LKFHTLSDHRCHFFLLNVYYGSIFCTTLLETVSLRVPNWNFRDFKLFHVDLNRRNCPSARCASSANAISRILEYSMIGLFWLMTCYWCKSWIRCCSSVTATFLNKSSMFCQGIDSAHYFFFIVLLHICFVSLVFCLVYLYCFVFYLCFSAGFVIGTCAVKSAR